MFNFKDFIAINESANNDLPVSVKSTANSLMNLDPDITIDPWPEKISKEGAPGDLLGIRMYLDDILFRINWTDNDNRTKMIDVWDANGRNQIMPKFSIIGNSELFRTIPKESLVKLIRKLANEKTVKSEEFVSEGFIRKMILENEGPKMPRIVNAPVEQTDDTVQPQSEFSDEEYSVFDDLRNLVIMVINNVNPSLIITGRGGIGKTHTVINTLKEFDIQKEDEYVVIKGAATALAMYKALYTNNEKIIIFDDCDSIFKDPDGVNILKGALDSYEDREISWLSRSTYDPKTQQPTETKPVPNKFMFEGQIIFISNLPMEKIDPAIRTRSYTIDINLSENDMYKIMEKNLPNVLPNVDLALKKEVLDFMKTEYKSAEETINVRTLIKAIKIRLSGAPNWKSLVKKYA